jgi:hypothetical protein
MEIQQPPPSAEIDKSELVAQGKNLNGWEIYSAIFSVSLLMQLLTSGVTWYNTVTYDYFCGNPLMGYWAQWFVASLIAGVIILPGGIWAIKHRTERRSIQFLIGSALYLLSMTLMLIGGAAKGTVPDFFYFMSYAFG